MKALIVDPAVHSPGGHHYGAVKRLQAELSRLGIEAPCLGSAFAESDAVRDLACAPSFQSLVYGRDYSEPKQFELSVAQMSRELSQAMRRHGAWPDILILPCCDQVLAASVAQALRRRLWKPAPQILMWLLYGPHHLLAPEHRAAEALGSESRRAFTSLLEATGERQRIAAYCETDAMAAFYRKLLPFDVSVAPGAGMALPVPAPASLATDQSTADRASADHWPNVTMIGFANRSKGYRLLPEAIQKMLSQDNTSTFTIHGIVAGSDAEDEAWIFDRLGEMGARIATRCDVLSEADYIGLLRRADLLLLPYDPEIYRARGSSVFTEARRMGIPVVAPSGCAFAQPAFDEGWGVAFSDYSAAGLANAIVEALARIDQLKARGLAAAAGAKDELGAILQTTIEAVRARPHHGVADAVRRLLGRAFQAQ
ncbi:MAG: hypothetical protein JWQ58_2000 [Reyranella sp.]|nr:hypothetical protein [Reyranella sp.]